MNSARVNGVQLEYEVRGSGEPLLSDPALVERYGLITYHQRGQVGSTRSPAPVSFAQHAADAAALLGHLGVRRAHVAGHSSGGDIALQLAFDRPDLVQTLALLEPALMSVPSAAAFFESAGPALAAYRSGDREAAMAAFLSAVCSLDWETCRAVLEEHVPGGTAQAIKDADTFFGSYLPALGAWQFGPNEAAAIHQPVLSVLGTQSERLFVEGRALLHSWFSQAEDLTIEGVGHLLHMQRPQHVVRGVAAFLGRHPITDSAARLPDVMGVRPAAAF
jgi:pimeloyl-ACP methyl ester carboxylesterase